MACPGGCVNGGGQPTQPASVRNFVDLKALRAKIAYLTEVLIKQYKTATRETLPWSGMAG